MSLCRYVKFDTFHPAVEKGLPVTRVISRVTLQQILAEACVRVAGEDVILNDCRVVDYEERVSGSSRFVSALSFVYAKSVSVHILETAPRIC